MDQALANLASMVEYKDSFYLGKTIADVAQMAIGIGLGIKGLGEIYAGLVAGTAGTGGGLVLVGSGVGSPAGIAVIGGSLVSAGALILDGSVSVGAGIGLFAGGASSFGDNLSQYNYFSKQACSSGTSALTVNCNGKSSPVYRGGNDFTIKNSDIRINPKTKLVRTDYGVSLDVNPETISKFGGAYKIESIPDGLNIIQRGGRPEHFEIVPAYEMTKEMFQNLLNQIVVSGPH